MTGGKDLLEPVSEAGFLSFSYGAPRDHIPQVLLDWPFGAGLDVGTAFTKSSAFPHDRLFVVEERIVTGISSACGA